MSPGQLTILKRGRSHHWLSTRSLPETLGQLLPHIGQDSEPESTQVPTGGRSGTSDLLISMPLDLCLKTTSALEQQEAELRICSLTSS